MNEAFQVHPVEHYDGARYFSPFLPDDPSEADERAPLVRQTGAIAMCLLTLGFLASCVPHQVDVVPTTPVHIVTVPGTPMPQIVTVRQAGCAEGTLQCFDADRVQYCQNNTWVSESCAQRCRQRFGTEFVSQGCLATAADPCRCVPDPDYGMLDGEAPMVEPDMLDGDPMMVEPDMLDGGREFVGPSML